MKVSKEAINGAADKVYTQLVATLGLSGARKCQLQVGRLLMQEKKRRDELDDGGKKRARSKTD